MNLIITTRLCNIGKQMRQQGKSFRITRTSRPTSKNPTLVNSDSLQKGLPKKNFKLQDRECSSKPETPFRVRDLEKSVSASAWGIYDLETALIYGNNTNLEREIASLSKVMTCIVVIQLVQKFKLSLDALVKVGKIAARIPGTSANLEEGSSVSVVDLLYGMMLPSGNDAAWALAESFGLLICYQELKSKEELYSCIESIDTSVHSNTTQFVTLFLEEMNTRARVLGLRNTQFMNPHGLTKPPNHSTVKDLIVLVKHCISNPFFLQIVGTKTYTAEFVINSETRNVEWKNTNRLLDQGWLGIKTGQTNPAGSCLASYKEGIVIVVLNSENVDKRFQDSQKLLAEYLRWKES